MIVNHPFKPFYNKDSEILILGSLPSVKSRELNFYYMHPQNRFWQILECLYNVELDTMAKKQEFLIKNKIALWDVIASCDIHSSSDSSIKKVKVNNINKLIKETNIKYIYTLGKKAYDLYNKYIYNKTKIPAIYLYSPSPANCKFKLEEMINNYQVIKKNN